MTAAAVPVCRQQVEAFLYAEAALLDAWALDQWLLLFDEDAKYEVSCPDAPDGDPTRDLMLIDDNYIRLQNRSPGSTAGTPTANTHTPAPTTRCSTCRWEPPVTGAR